MSPINISDYRCQAMPKGKPCPNRAYDVVDIAKSPTIATAVCTDHRTKRTSSYGPRKLWASGAAPNTQRPAATASAPVPVQPATLAPALTGGNGNAAGATVPAVPATPRARARHAQPAPPRVGASTAPVLQGNPSEQLCTVCADVRTTDVRHVDHKGGADCNDKCFVACPRCVGNAEHVVPPLPPLEEVELPPSTLRQIGGAEERRARRSERLEELRRERDAKVTERLEAMRVEQEQRAKVAGLVELFTAGHIVHPQQALDLFNASEIRPAFREPLFAPWRDLVIQDLVSLGEDGEVAEVSEEQRETWIRLAYGSTETNGFFRRVAPTLKEFREKILAKRREYRASAAEQARRAEADLEKLRAQAAPILNDPIAAIEAELPRIGFGGAIGVPMLLNASAETRLLRVRDGILLGHTQVTGGSGAGKTYTIKRGLRALLPDECVIELDVSSPRLLVYDERDYKFKLLILNEADALPGRRADAEDNVGAVIVRSLLSENRVKYETLVKDAESSTGQKRVSIEREGPTVLITAIVDAISPTSQLGTRLQSVPVPEDAEQDAAALESQADTEERGYFLPTNPAILALRLLHQRMAEAAGGLDVVVPFYRVFARLLQRRRGDGRLKRDSARFLSTIKGITLLRLEQRERDTQGRYICTLEDYQKFIEWAEPIYENSVTGVNPDMRDMIAVIGELTDPEAHRPQMTVTTRQILAQLNDRRRAQAALEGRQIPRVVPRRTLARWLARAVELGYVKNRTELWQQKSGYAGMYELGEELPSPTALPTVEEIQAELERRAA